MTASFTRACRVSIAGLILALLGAAPPPADAGSGYSRSEEPYVLPEVTLIDQDGEPVSFGELATSDKPVMVDFVYATCTTICPVLSAAFSSLQRRLGDDATAVRLVSVTIDPEHDTPELMKDYLTRYKARDGWDFLTGSREDIDRVMRAFDAYVPDKMSHFPVTFVKAPGKKTWVRIYGLIGTKDLLSEYRQALEDDRT